MRHKATVTLKTYKAQQTTSRRVCAPWGGCGMVLPVPGAFMAHRREADPIVTAPVCSRQRPSRQRGITGISGGRGCAVGAGTCAGPDRQEQRRVTAGRCRPLCRGYARASHAASVNNPHAFNAAARRPRSPSRYSWRSQTCQEGESPRSHLDHWGSRIE